MDYFILKAKHERESADGLTKFTDYTYYCANNIVRQQAWIDGKQVDATTFTCSGRLTVVKTEDVIYIAPQTLPSGFVV